MKKTLFFIVFITSAFLLNAQLPAWTVRTSNTIKWFSGEDKEKNIIVLRSKELGNKQPLSLSYKPAGDDKDWIRTLMIDDSTGAGIIELPEIKSVKKSKTQITYTISGKQLKEILARHKKILIYFTSIPSDPAKAAVVRVRPVHICTVWLTN